ENVAVAMAHGFYQVTGRPQAVMVHVNVGTANALNGIINASRDNIPMLVAAGRTPLTEQGQAGSRDIYIHWSQECFDQAGMVREFVKWDYELHSAAQLPEVVDRALEIAMAEPRGPVYLSLPREVLAEPVNAGESAVLPRRHTGGRLHPDPEVIDQAASLLAGARHPLIITTSSGRNPQTVGHLVELAESFAIPVVTFNPRYLCFPTDHRFHLGFTPYPLLAAADLILVVDSNVPWYPSFGNPDPNSKVIQLGIDPFYSDYPIRSFPCDLAIQADSAVAIPLLTQALRFRRTLAEPCIADRAASLTELHRKQRDDWKEALKKARSQAPLDPRWVSHCIGEIMDEDTLIFNEYDLDQTQVELTRPGSFFGNTSAGGLGWGLGAAIGAKLAAPEKSVISTVGDGSYLFGNPTPAHFVSHALGAPTLTVIFNNGTWNAVRQSNLGMYPEGWAARTGNMPLSKLEPSPRYEMLVAASEGYGERVEKPAEVLPALQRALAAVREEGRSAVLNMICQVTGR
ncbi:thiamine pyrophosphate-requiring protein, partial [Geomonas sp.]|uniref:thiamine pyrophosphate-requiring protein n=1 Tax=Geomonas sp. TaxID=2651584 RepID=UPI002B47DC59